MTKTLAAPPRAAGRFTIPEQACRLRGPFATLELPASAAGEGEAKAQRTFRMIANTGKKMNLGWWGSLVLDMQGLQAKQQLPALLQHDVDQRVGFTQKVTIGNDGVVAEGQLLRASNEHVAAILADADDGYPWQVSIGMQHEEIQLLLDGEYADVNGKRVEGPCYVSRRCTLREVSFVTLGADDDTHADALASGAGAVECLFTHEEAMPETKPPTGENPPAATTATTPQQLRAQFPELAATLCAEAAHAAVAAERDRTGQILAAAHGDQGKLSAELIKTGASSTDALQKLNADLKTKLDASKAATLGGRQTEEPLGGTGNSDTTLDPSGKLRAQFPGDDRGQKAYEAYIKRHAGDAPASA